MASASIRPLAASFVPVEAAATAIFLRFDKDNDGRLNRVRIGGGAVLEGRRKGPTSCSSFFSFFFFRSLSLSHPCPFSLPDSHLQDELSSFVEQVNPSMRFTDDQMEAILDEVSESKWEKS
jgi:hypothetical protein